MNILLVFNNVTREQGAYNLRVAIVLCIYYKVRII
jgi:hypothetical protein